MAEEMRVLLPQENENLTDLQSYINAGGYKSPGKSAFNRQAEPDRRSEKSGLRGRGWRRLQCGHEVAVLIQRGNRAQIRGLQC